MGCCLTTPTTTPTATAAGDHHHHHQHVDSSKPTSKQHGGRPPPVPAPAPEEEETVKEVLSETPIKPPPPSNSTGNNHQILLHPQNDVVVRFTKTPIGEDEVSSEIYTYSESFSNATTTTTTTTTSFAKDLKKPKIGIDEDGEVTQKLKNRPPARKQPMTSFSGERARRKERGIRPPAPARKSTIPSTDKKIQIPARNLTTQRHRNVVPSNSGRRESPARRSRSPAIRKVKEKSPVPKSGDRIPVNATENKGNFKLKENTDAGVSPVPEPVPETEIRESLENPLVSLECFIFL